ncbi:MAG TPA: hypothetical protein VEH79_02785 [Gaiellaceae bacterium]|nr:hypothetical protein [Gaiellaceae bacterium]
MLLKVWVGLISVTCGFLVTWFLGGSRPPIIWILAAFGVLGAITLLPDRSWARPTWSEREPEPLRPADPAPDDVEINRGVVSDVLRIVRATDVEELRREDFSSPWPKRRVEPYETLFSAQGSMSRPLDLELDLALETLLSQTAAFLDFYRAHTVADPLVASGEWQMLADAGAETTPRRARFERESEQLRDRAQAVASAYDQFVAVAARRNWLPRGAPTPRLSPNDAFEADAGPRVEPAERRRRAG